jgi:hypothetical protein
MHLDHLISRPRLERFDNFFRHRPSPWSKVSKLASFPAMSFQMVSLIKALFSSPKKQKVFKILRHIESYGTCMKH